MASQPARSRSRSRDADPPRRDPEREQLERDLDDLERWKETGELPPGYDSREQLERDLADLSRLNDQRELPPGYSYLPPRPPPPPRRFQRSDRVVCSLGGGFGWLPGAVQSVNEPNPQDPTELVSVRREARPAAGEADIGAGRPEELLPLRRSASTATCRAGRSSRSRALPVWQSNLRAPARWR